MAVVVSIDKLRRGFAAIAGHGTSIVVRLRNPETVYRDRDTGWTIRGDEEKELLLGLTGFPAQSLLAAIRAGRFVKVGVKGRGKKSKVQGLVEYIVGQSDEDLGLMPDAVVTEAEEADTPEPDGNPSPEAS
jgi:hypothetical protein